MEIANAQLCMSSLKRDDTVTQMIERQRWPDLLLDRSESIPINTFYLTKNVKILNQSGTQITVISMRSEFRYNKTAIRLLMIEKCYKSSTQSWTLWAWLHPISHFRPIIRLFSTAKNVKVTLDKRMPHADIIPFLSLICIREKTKEWRRKSYRATFSDANIF